MVQTVRAAVVIAEGDGVPPDLPHTAEALARHDTTGTAGRQGTEEGPTTCTAEVGDTIEVMAGVSNTRWWKERGGGRRCYDKGQKEG